MSPPKKRPSKSHTVDNFEYAFPTVIRWTGLGLTLVLVGFSLAGYTAEAAPGFVAATGMILYKTVRNAAESINEETDHDNE